MTRRIRHRYQATPASNNTSGYLGDPDASSVNEAGRMAEATRGYRSDHMSPQVQQQFRRQIDQALQTQNIDSLREILQKNPDLLSNVPGVAEQLRNNGWFQQQREGLINQLSPVNGVQNDGQMPVNPAQQSLVQQLQSLTPRISGEQAEMRRAPPESGVRAPAMGPN